MKRLLLGALASVLVLGFSGLSRADDVGKYGKNRVAEYDLPSEMIDKFARFKASEPDPHATTPGERLMLADSEDWVGPALEGKSNAGPYTVVITVTAFAREPGDAELRMNAGWQLGSDGMTRLSPMPTLRQKTLRGGEQFTLTGVTAPLRFKEDRDVAVALGLVKAENMKIEKVHVAVWSGVRETTWLEILSSFRWALGGLIMIAVWFLFFRREKSSSFD